MNNKFIRLFLSTFKLSACTFGGGFVIVPLMRQKFVHELGWIEDDEMLDLVSIAQSSPGAIAVNVSMLVGYRIAGFKGALISVLGTVLPPLIIISVISLFYNAFRSNAIVNAAMSAMLCGVAAVILDVVINMISMLIKQKRLLPFAVFLSVFIAVRFFSANIAVVMLLCALTGAADIFFSKERRK